ncbi:MAG: SDR family oxidoreductase [Jatrophihabitantaceae bacterium]
MRRPDLSSLAGRRVLITGAASGIGRATALAAAAKGAELYLTDINATLLAQTAGEINAAGGTVGFLKALDIADFDQVQDFGIEVDAAGGSMDVVMNIAGVSAWGTVENLEHKHWKSMVDINLMGPIHIIETFVPPMVAAGRGGHIVNVSSAAGLIGMPWHAAYSASKFGLRGVSEVLRFDLRRHGIGVSLVCPGGVATPLTETIQIAGLDKQTPQFQKLQANFRKRAVTPEQAAASILRGVSRDTYLVYTSNDIRLIHQLQKKCEPLYVMAMRAMNHAANRALPMPSKAPNAPSAAKSNAANR